MNSSQRRKIKRGYPHVINLVAENEIRYFDHDDKVMTARNWCSRNCRGSFRVDLNWDKAKFMFSTEKDAVIFALKWL